MEAAASADQAAAPAPAGQGSGSTQILQDAILDKLRGTVADDAAQATSESPTAEVAQPTAEAPNEASEASTQVMALPPEIEAPPDDAFSETSWFMTTEHIDDLKEIPADNIEFDEQAYAPRTDLKTEIRKKYSLDADDDSEPADD